LSAHELKSTEEGVKVLLTCLAVVVAVLGAAGPAAAYVGPGAGLSLVGAFWGLLVAVFAALAFIVIWPVRRLLRRGRGAPAAELAMAEGKTDQAERPRA
jgi:membrane protein implicated in regulation of membrane protease activity